MADGRDIRSFVDGELPPAEMARIERAALEDADLAARIAFERGLRQRVATALDVSGEGHDPAQLAAAVRSRLSEAACQPRAEGGEDAHPAPAPIRFSAAAQPASRTRINPFAVAACLAIVAGAILVGIFGTPLHQIRGVNDPAQAAAQRIGEQAISGHNRCRLMVESSRVEALITDRAAIARFLDARLGVPMPVFRFDDIDYILIGAVPVDLQDPASGRQSAVQIMYRRLDNGVYLSVFIEHALDVAIVDSVDAVYTPDPSCCVMRYGSMVYAIVAGDPSIHQPVIERMQQQLNLR